MTKTFIALLFMTSGLLVNSQRARAADPEAADKLIVAPAEAISRLKEGNGRYTSGNQQHPHQSGDERGRMAANSYENLGMTAAEAAKRREELAKVSTLLLSLSGARIRAFRLRSCLIKD